jgi:hypothetical protein
MRRQHKGFGFDETMHTINGELTTGKPVKNDGMKRI